MHIRSALLLEMLLFIAICAAGSSCATYRGYHNGDDKIAETESRLAEAGFRKVPIQTPRQHSATDQLPLGRLNQYQSGEGSVYWYADPKFCGCLFEGDQTAYNRFADLIRQQHETAEYVNYQRPYEVADLSPFGEVFPSPLLGWPMVVYLDGPISPHGSGFSPAYGAIQSAGGYGGKTSGAIGSRGFGGYGRR